MWKLRSNCTRALSLSSLVWSLSVGCAVETRNTTYGSVDAGEPSTVTPGSDGGAAGGGSTSGGGTSGQANGTSTDDFVGCTKMDILFVIDNSGSMGEEQANLAANFPKFIEVLNAFNDGKIDYHVGVTTTSFPTEFLGIMVGTGEEGALLKGPSMQRPWLERSDPDVSGTFTNLATVGVMGSGQEQQLKAAQMAITERVTDQSNAGFLRKDALLAVIILTDEDDGSTGAPQMGGLPIPLPGNEIPVSEFITTFDTVTGDRGRWAAAVIAGDQAPMCSSQFGNANYATRLLDFVMQTGNNAVFSSICEGDLSKSLQDALDTFSEACDTYILI